MRGQSSEDLILGRVSGIGLEKAGIIAGMSGSPIYVDEKLNPPDDEEVEDDAPLFDPKVAFKSRSGFARSSGEGPLAARGPRDQSSRRRDVVAHAVAPYKPCRRM